MRFTGTRLNRAIPTAMRHPRRRDPFDCVYLDDKTSFAWISSLNQEIYSGAPIKSPRVHEPLYMPAMYHPLFFYVLPFLFTRRSAQAAHMATDNTSGDLSRIDNTVEEIHFLNAFWRIKRKMSCESYYGEKIVFLMKEKTKKPL